VKVPNNVKRFLEVATDSGTAYLPLEDLIGAHLQQLFPGMEVTGHHPFRVTRNADVEVEEDRDEDLLQAMERELARRRFGPGGAARGRRRHGPARAWTCWCASSRSPTTTSSGARACSTCPRSGSSTRPTGPTSSRTRSCRRRTRGWPEGEKALTCSPRCARATCSSTTRTTRSPRACSASSSRRPADPHVLAIKQTLYRTSGDSPIVDALVDAAQAGKQVVVLVEITARFDEQANIRWARELEKAGCHVVYGLVGLKTHCKTSLVVRQEKGQLRRYAHIGTGNYNPKTARMYEDFGLLTADPEVGADLTDLFNTLTGYSRQTRYRTLMVAPHGVRAGLVERIRRQADLAHQGLPARVRIKANSVVDEQVIDALYGASRAGVRWSWWCAGICALSPGVPGLSENIDVRSIVGRFLEHSRVMVFGTGDDAEHWMGSADLMHRNLDRRVETLVRVKDPTVAAHLDAVLDRSLAPDTRHWELQQDGCWEQRPGPGEPARDLQAELMRRSSERGDGA
jgi:polyphosphate kinase